MPQGRTINAEFYYDQLDRLQNAMQEKRPNRQGPDVHFLHDNARPHTARLTKNKIDELEWSVVRHPPYSPDLAPTDYKVFRSLQNFLNGKEFRTEDELKSAIQQWIDGKPSGFWVKGIADLPRRWALVQQYEGDYFPDD